jgi:hypothetical protein
MQNQIIIYQPEVGLSSLEVRLENETVWLTQNQMAELFDKNRKTITEHINNIYKELELQRNSTSRKFQLVQKEGGREIVREIEHYNLDVIISVGYRVKSKRGTQFRIWANKVLKEYLLRGHAFQVRLEKAEKSIVLVDNYIDETVLSMISKRNKGIKATIYTANLSKELSLDLKKHNAQYEPVKIKVFSKSHDRFLIIDEKTVYHIGGSLKDLGKKLFAFSRIEINPQIILNYLLNLHSLR